MGIPGFLPDLINSQGRLIDIREFHPRRIAIDISTWIHNATQMNGEMLADERHLSNYGRATLVMQQEISEDEFIANEAEEKEKMVTEFIAKCSRDVIRRVQNFQQATNAKVIVVLDGQTPPIKATTTRKRRNKREDHEKERDRPVDLHGASPQAEQRRFKANRSAGAGKHYFTVIHAVIQGMRENKIPFLVAPYESDAQLALLQNEGLIDLVVTEDSDLVAYGLATPVLYKLKAAEDGAVVKGYLIRREDLGAVDPEKGRGKFNLLDFGPSLLASLFAASGCDYCDNLKGVGVGKACGRIRDVFLEHTKGDQPPLAVLLKKLFESSFASGSMSDAEKTVYTTSFLKALFMFRHAIVYNPRQGRFCPLTPFEQADPEFLSFPEYAEMVKDTKSHSAIIGESLGDSSVETYIAEGWICPRSKTLRPNSAAPLVVQSALAEYNGESVASETHTNEKPAEQIDRQSPPSSSRVNSATRAPLTSTARETLPTTTGARQTPRNERQWIQPSPRLQQPNEGNQENNRQSPLSSPRLRSAVRVPLASAEPGTPQTGQRSMQTNTSPRRTPPTSRDWIRRSPRLQQQYEFSLGINRPESPPSSSAVQSPVTSPQRDTPLSGQRSMQTRAAARQNLQNALQSTRRSARIQQRNEGSPGSIFVDKSSLRKS